MITALNNIGNHAKIFAFGATSLLSVEVLDKVGSPDVYKLVIALSTLAVHVIQLIRERRLRKQTQKIEKEK